MPQAERGKRQATKRRAANLTANQVVADQVRWLRDNRKITQQELADSLGWTQSQVARLELGRRAVTVADLLALAWALDVAPVYLLAGSFNSAGDIPVTEQLRVSPDDMRKWIRGGTPLPGTNYRRYFENIPDDEWRAAYGEAAEQRRTAAEYFEQIEGLLESGATRRPGSERSYTAEEETKHAEERSRRRGQLDAAKRTKKNVSGGS
jgi:transcriptional regulator with XRE-family HTH domain